MKHVMLANTLGLALIACSAWAQSHDHPAPAVVAEASQPAAMTEAEVRQIDKAAGKITLKHGEIRNLEMPAMTMAFAVKDPAMLEQVKVGDKVKFAAEKVGRAYTVTVIQPVK
jgi:Cu/Ag efflux protein CusF